MRITLNEAIQRLKQAEVVAIPTDTVYGLAADFRKKGAVEKIFQLKGRPETKPIPLLAACREDVEPLIQEIPPYFNELAEKFWPGALTLVVPARVERIPDCVRLGKKSVALRVPNHLLVRKLLYTTQPLAVSSANRSGQEPLKSSVEIEECFGKDFPILEGEEESCQLASTVLEWQDKRWVLLRKGMVEAEALCQVLGDLLELKTSLE